MSDDEEAPALLSEYYARPGNWTAPRPSSRTSTAKNPKSFAIKLTYAQMALV
jgi:hypothetical protein